MMYWLTMDQRMRQEEVAFQLESQTFNLYPERWRDIYLPDLLRNQIPQDEDGEVVTDIDDLDAYFANLERQEQRINGSEAFSFGGHKFSDTDQWDEWR